MSPLPTTSHIQGWGNGVCVLWPHTGHQLQITIALWSLQMGMRRDTTLSGCWLRAAPASLPPNAPQCLSTALFQRLIYYGETHTHTPENVLSKAFSKGAFGGVNYMHPSWDALSCKTATTFPCSTPAPFLLHPASGNSSAIRG